MPKGVCDRPADVWEPLLAIAAAAGGQWPKRARDACVELVKAAQSADSRSLGLRLLADLRTVLDSSDWMGTEAILARLCKLDESPLARLCKLDESPWSDLKGKPLDSRGLPYRLKPYGITSTKVKIGDASVRGYRREELHDAWQRYLPAPVAQAEPPEPAWSDGSDQVPDTEQVPEPLLGAEPDERSRWSRSGSERVKLSHSLCT